MHTPSFTLYRGIKQRGMGLPMHVHAETQLTFAASGMVQVHTAQGRWLVPPQLAVWIPEGTPHRLEVLSEAELWMVQWNPSVARAWAPVALDRAFALHVTPLLRALLASAFAAGIGDAVNDAATDTAPGIAPAKAELLARLMLHELTETAHAPTFLPMPASPAGKRLAEVALGDCQQRLSLAELATRAATSVRTASRLFPEETGLTFKAWRQRARIVQAMDRLARGTPIARVVAQFGFSSTASFSCAFRQVTAMTPTQFLGQADAAQSA